MSVLRTHDIALYNMAAVHSPPRKLRDLQTKSSSIVSRSHTDKATLNLQAAEWSNYATLRHKAGANFNLSELSLQYQLC